jgi:hypothetical protein
MLAPTDRKTRERELARLRKQRQRDRDRAKVTSSHVKSHPVTPPENPCNTSQNPPVTPPDRDLSRIALGTVTLLVGVVLGGCAVTASAWVGFHSPKGVGAWILTGACAATELATCVLPSIAMSRRGLVRFVILGVMLMSWVVSAHSTSGFVLTNLTDGTEARAETITPDVQLAMDALRDARRDRDRECTKQVGLCRRAHDQVTAAEQRLEQARRAVVTASDPQAAAFHVTSLELSSERAGELVWTLTVLPGLLDGMGLGNGTQAIMKPRAHRTLWTLVFATRLQRYDTLQEAQDERDRQWKRGVSCWVQPPLAAWGGNHRTSDHSQQGAAVVGTLSLRASAFAAGVVSF